VGPFPFEIPETFVALPRLPRLGPHDRSWPPPRATLPPWSTATTPPSRPGPCLIWFSAGFYDGLRSAAPRTSIVSRTGDPIGPPWLHRFPPVSRQRPRSSGKSWCPAQGPALSTTRHLRDLGDLQGQPPLLPFAHQGNIGLGPLDEALRRWLVPSSILFLFTAETHPPAGRQTLIDGRYAAFRPMWSMALRCSRS